MSDAVKTKMDRRSWHRKASKPIMYWMIALIVVAFTHPLIPQFRWLMVHMVTLGLVTSSIMMWSQHFTEALLKTRLGEETRPTQVRRMWILTAAIVVTMIGMVGSWPWVAVVGALGVSAVMLWYAFSLGAQIKAALAPRFAFVVRSYLVAALLLPVGAALGAALTFSPGEPWQGRLLLAHQIVNILGFVGVTATATLLTLWPTVLRTKLDGTKATRASRSLILMVAGVVLAVVGALINNLLVGVSGIVLYLAGQLSVMFLLVGLARRAARQERREPIPLFPALSLGAGTLWFVGTTLALAIMWVGAGGGADGSSEASALNFSLVATDVQQLTIPFVVGFLLQLLLGAMSFLMPTAMGGGPRALRASLKVMSAGAVFRVVSLNLALALFAFASIDSTLGAGLFGLATFGIFGPAQFGSVTRVLVSLVAFGVLVTFLVLLIRMVKVNVRERIEFQERVGLGMPSAGLPVRGTDVSGTQTIPATPQSENSNAPSSTPSANAASSAAASKSADSTTGTTAASSPTAAASGGSPSLSAAAAKPKAQSLTEATMGRGPGHEKPATNVGRRHLTGALLGAGSVLGLSAVGRAFDGTLGGGGGTAATEGAEESESGTAATGETTTAQVKMTPEMRFVPDTIEVPAGNTLEIELVNTDPGNAHDLVLETGENSGRLQPQQTTTLKTGVISGNVEGWCSIVGHRAMGMVLHITATGAAGTTQQPSGHEGHSGHSMTTSADPLARVSSDFATKPGASHKARDPRVPAVGATPQNHTFTVTEEHLELAPGVAMDAMTFNGKIMGPTIVSEIGGKVNLKLVNKGTMGHSIDFHAGMVSPTTYMRTIANGESLDYPFTTDYAGIWLYHCSTMPMTVHLSSGMYGALIVPPADLPKVDHEYVLVQSDHYLVPEALTDDSGTAVKGPDGTEVHAVSSDKIFAERPDFTVFNGHATQYRHAPLTAKVGERIRIWVLAAGPNKPISFHVVGTIFDTVFKEGTYTLRPDNDTGGGSQALDLGACQGGFVEMTFREPGTYKAVNHNFSDLERGAMAAIEVTE